MMTKRAFRSVLTATLLLCGPAARSQTAGGVLGRVLDGSGAPVPEAKIVTVHSATESTREANTDGEGRYAISNLPIGTYRVTVEAANFRRQVHPEVRINVGQVVTLDFHLEIGVFEQEMEVTAEAPLVDVNGSAGITMSNRQIIELPINGRDYARFSQLSAGAVVRTGLVADLSFNGLHTVHNQFSIDGIDASRVDQPYMANGYERGARLLTGNLDTIDEFRVQSGTYAAQYGRAAGSYINIATRSGSNQFHGAVFSFLRNNVFDARNYFNKKPDPQAGLRYEDFGWHAGGPLQKDKTFLFASYEGTRQRIGITGSGTTPSPALRDQVLAQSPALKGILDQFPQGTAPSPQPLVDLYTTVAVSAVREDTASFRADHNFSPVDSAYLRLNVNDTRAFGPLFGVSASALGRFDNQNVPVRTVNAALHHQHIFGPGLLNEILAGTQRWNSRLIADNPYPLVSVTGLTIAPGSRGRSRSVNTSEQIGDLVSMVQGAHTLKAGFTAYRVQVERQSADTLIIFYTSLADLTANRVAMAVSAAGGPGSVTRAYQTGLFVQDTWQARPGVTVEYGLRHDYSTPPFDPAGRARPFDPRTGALASAGAPYSRSNTNDWGPRLGVVWAAASRLMARAGYGVFWQAPSIGSAADSVPGNTTPGNVTLTRQLIPSLSFPVSAFLSQGTFSAPTVGGFDWIKRDVQVQHWNATLEWQLTDSTRLDATYAGSHGVNLSRSLNVNLYDPALQRRPYAQFSSINLGTNTGQSTYGSLQLALSRRFRAGFQLGLNYTWAHAIDDVQDEGLYSSGPQDNRNLKAERGNASGDVRHSLSFNALYRLPWGRRVRWLRDWQIAGVGILRSGMATTVYIGQNTFGNGNATNQRPDAVVGVSPYPARQPVDAWLNPAAFQMPASGTFGNLGRNTIFGPDLVQLDASLSRQVRVREKFVAQFRGEVFNVQNHPNFAAPNTTFGTAAFGRILSTVGRTLGMGTSRQIQFGVRLDF